ncbi:hypothetical protein J8N05_46975 (plasmid) [Streptomyces sp. BH-SS-21]|uniref:Uncharacterized protein n=1 Tax=Streptomyces liliiviolaceus TaxID=2823109 RepID=A0A940YAN9_9ACTN|nr:hypothetical protein [Streptomyces liliiviolaceus]MBQ0855705.1 hypothetical protein [Streptomyces liliiviolaceus]
MTPCYRLILSVTALLLFTALTIFMLREGQPTGAISTAILAIVVGVQQLSQTFDRPARSEHRPQTGDDRIDGSSGTLAVMAAPAPKDEPGSDAGQRPAA